MVYFYFASKFKYAFLPAFFKFVSSNGIVARAVHIMRQRRDCARRLFDIMAVSLQTLSTEDLLEKLKEAGIRH